SERVYGRVVEQNRAFLRRYRSVLAGLGGRLRRHAAERARVPDGIRPGDALGLVGQRCVLAGNERSDRARVSGGGRRRTGPRDRRDFLRSVAFAAVTRTLALAPGATRQRPRIRCDHPLSAHAAVAGAARIPEAALAHSG